MNSQKKVNTLTTQQHDEKVSQFPEVVLDFKCDKEGHESNQAGVVCLNPECISNRVICCKCFFSEHPSHCCMPFTDFYFFLNKYLQNHEAILADPNSESLSFEKLLTQRNELFANMQRKLNYYLELFNANTARQQKMMNQLVPFTSLTSIGTSQSLEELRSRIGRATNPSAITYTPNSSTPHQQIIYDYLEAQFKEFDQGCLKMKKQNEQIENLINNDCKNLFQKIGEIIDEQYAEQKLQDMIKIEEASQSILQHQDSEPIEAKQQSTQLPKIPRRQQNRSSRSRSRSKFSLSRGTRAANQNCNKKEVESLQEHQELMHGIEEFQNDQFKEAKQTLTKYLQEMRQSYGEQNELAKSKAYYYLGCTQKKLHELDDSIINLRISLNKYKKYLGKHALEVADTHFILGNVYKKMSNFKEAVEYHRKALAIREGFISQYPDQVARSYFYLGKVYNKKCEPKQAIIYHQKALGACPENCKKLSSDANIWLGIDYFQLQQYNEALTYFNAALKLQQDDPNMQGKMTMGWSYYWIGVIKRNLKENQTSIENLLLAEKIFKENNQQNQQVLAPIYDDLAGIYRDSQMYNLALKYYLQLEKIVDKDKMDQIELAEIYASCGIAYKELKEYQNAISYLTNSMKLFEKHGKTVGIRKRFHKKFDKDQKLLMNKCLLALGEAFYEVAKYKEASKILEKVNAFFDEDELKNQSSRINELKKNIEQKLEVQ